MFIYILSVWDFFLFSFLHLSYYGRLCHYPVYSVLCWLFIMYYFCVSCD